MMYTLDVSNVSRIFDDSLVKYTMQSFPNTSAYDSFLMFI